MALTQESLWLRTLEEEPPLPSDGDIFSLITDPACFQSFITCMDELDETHPHRAIASQMIKLEQYFDCLNSITATIKVLTSEASAAVSQIWRTTQAVMMCASKITTMFETVVEQLQEFIPSMKQLQKLITLSPGSHELHQPLRCFHKEYTVFCVTTAIRLHDCSIYNSHEQDLLTRKSIEAKALIARHVNEFEEQSKLEENLAHGMRGLLTALGENVERPRTALPIHWGIAPRNSEFFGRDRSLEEMNKHLTGRPQPSHDVPVTYSCTVCGLGGMGKTRAALEYVHRFKHEYDCIFWLPSQDTTQLSGSYAHIARLVSDVGDRNPEDLTRNIELTRTWLLHTSLKWLLVFDNVEDLKTLQAFKPTAGNGSVIITTQQPNLDINNEFGLCVSLQPLSAENGAKSLCSYLVESCNVADLEWNNIALAQEISEAVGGLPLALSQISGYLSESKHSLSQFLAALRRMQQSRPAIIQNSKKPFGMYEQVLRDVHAIALEDLEPNARKLLNTLAFLNPDAAQEKLLTSREYLRSFNSSFNLNEIGSSLSKRQLVRTVQSSEDSAFAIHRSLQRNLLRKLDEDPLERQRVFESSCSLVRRVIPKSSSIQVPSAKDWENSDKYIPHVLSLETVFSQSKPPISGTLEFAIILRDIGTYMWDRMLVTEGISSLNTALRVLDSIGFDDLEPMRADIYVYLGILNSYNGISCRQEELKFRKMALKLREVSFQDIPPEDITRDDEIRLFNVRADVAFGHLQTEDFEEAKNILEECYERYKTWGSEDMIPFEYAKYYHILAYYFMSTGQHSKAIEFAEKSLSLKRRAIQSESFLSSQYKFMLACFHFFAKDIRSALALHHEVMKDRISMWGQSDRRTLNSRYMVAAMYEFTGDFAEAEKMLQSLIDDPGTSLWPEECVARAKYLLSIIVAKYRKDKARALLLEREAEKILKRLLLRVPHWIKQLGVANRMALYDHIVPFGAGRMSGKMMGNF